VTRSQSVNKHAFCTKYLC